MRRREGLSHSYRSAGHRLFLLLFFLSGALLVRFSPALAQRLPCTEQTIPLLLLAPALLSGSLFGTFLLPFGALVLGMLSMMRPISSLLRLLPVSALGLPGGEDLTNWLRGLAPQLVLLPAYFVLTVASMEISDLREAAYSRADAGNRRALMRRELLIVSAACCAALAYRFY